MGANPARHRRHHFRDGTGLHRTGTAPEIAEYAGIQSGLDRTQLFRGLGTLGGLLVCHREDQHGCLLGTYESLIREDNMKAFGYIRVSGLTQLDGGGPERQREAITTYCLKNDIELVKFFQDAFTGTELERPSFREMRQELLADGIRTVIVEKLDRLARDLLIQETILADFRKNNFTVISTVEPDLCSADPSRKFFRQIMGAVAEYDRSMLVARMKDGKRRVLATGKRCGGRTPYGEHPDYPSEKEVVETIKRCHQSGIRTAIIAATLNRNGIVTRKGGLWFPAQISRILRAD